MQTDAQDLIKAHRIEKKALQSELSTLRTAVGTAEAEKDQALGQLQKEHDALQQQHSNLQVSMYLTFGNVANLPHATGRAAAAEVPALQLCGLSHLILDRILVKVYEIGMGCIMQTHSPLSSLLLLVS